MLLCRGGEGARGHARVEIGGERGERHLAKACEQQCLGLAKAGVQRGVDRLFDEASGRLCAIAHRHQAGAPDRVIDVAHRDAAEIFRDRPAAAVPLFAVDEPSIAEAPEDAADDDGMRLHRLRELLRGHRGAMLGHMEEDVEHARESAIAFHVTLNSA